VFGDGTQTRSFCYVDDNVDCIWRLLHGSHPGPINVGNPHELSVLDFARAVQQFVGSHCEIEHRPLPEDDPKLRRPDITLAKEALGWEPRVGLEEGMRRTIAWFRERV
jgi:dTDP-glucose 4,6-dehydratase